MATNLSGTTSQPIAGASKALSGYITKAFPYVQQQNSNQLALGNFDAQSLLGQQQQRAQDSLQTTNLQQQLADLGQQSAGSLASRGLLRSGLNFKAQDKINQQGVNQQSAIDQQYTNLLSQQEQGRLSVIQQNNAALDQVISQLASQFNRKNRVG